MAVTAGTAIQASLTVPGHPDQVRAARAFVGRVLGAGHPCAMVAALLVSELVTNSVLHSYSGLPGGAITITVTSIPAGVRVEVHDAGSPSVPLLRNPDDGLAEGGRGLQLVSHLATAWDYCGDENGLVTWFELGSEAPE